MYTGFRPSVPRYLLPRLSCAEARETSRRHGFLRRVTVLLDQVLRHWLGIREFTANPRCLLRIATSRVQTHTKVTLTDGTPIRPADTLIDLHFWNEHFVSLLAEKGPCARANLIRRHLELSMHLLAAYLTAHPEINARIIHARVALPVDDGFARLRGITERCGFSVTTRPAGRMAWPYDFFEDFLMRALRWTFNPGRPRRGQVRLSRADLWIERAKFVARHLDYERCHEVLIEEACSSD